MKNTDINIRDPFVLVERDTYYLYGTRASNFGQEVGGFDVYTSKDMVEWSEPIEVFNSAKHGMDICVNWAPEVHKYKGSYYMFATFTMPHGRRGTHILKADSPLGPFVPHSDRAVTPHEWEALDGTLYIENDIPYIVFCHEHIQIADGTVCYAQLSDDLSHTVGDVVTMFSGSSPYWADKKPEGEHYTTDGPFMYRTKDDVLLMIWSTFIGDDYIEAVVRFNEGTITGAFEHLPPFIDDDGGHGMIFKANDKLYLTYHTPNQTDYERPVFMEIKDCGDTLVRA